MKRYIVLGKNQEDKDYYVVTALLSLDKANKKKEAFIKTCPHCS